jgi:pilus assembly protein CpaC
MTTRTYPLRVLVAAVSAALAFASAVLAQPVPVGRTGSPYAALQGAAVTSARIAPTMDRGFGAPIDAGASQPGVVRVDLSSSRSQILALPRGKSAIIELPLDARDILISNPDIADAVLRTPRRIYILGMKAGQTDAVFFDAAGRRLLTLDVRVDQDTGALTQTISRLVPGSSVKVEGLNESIILSGVVANLADADRVVQLSQQFVTKPEQVINMLTIAGKDQVMLKVRIVEMQRSVIKQLGVNLSAVLNQIGEPQYLLGTAATWSVNGGLLGGLTGGYDLNTTKQPLAYLTDAAGKKTDVAVIDRNYALSTPTDTVGKPGLNQAAAKLQAFERVGLVRTLAEPTLTAVSGESAKFLAGGEYPVPTGQDSSGKTTVEFKPYGVGLGFTPMVLSGGRIALKLSTEVSELSSNGAFTLTAGSSGSSALTINALTVNRVESSIELPSGGSLMIAGLLKEKTRQALDSLPGMMNLPVLGSLFRSRDYQSGQTELVVIVTPYIVGAVNPADLQTPDTGMRMANDAETYLLGRLNKVNRKSGTRSAKAGSADAGPSSDQTFVGPFGYVIE